MQGTLRTHSNLFHRPPDVRKPGRPIATQLDRLLDQLLIRPTLLERYVVVSIQHPRGAQLPAIHSTIPSHTLHDRRARTATQRQTYRPRAHRM